MAGLEGLFVHVPDPRKIGKVVRQAEHEIEVAFFHSLAKRETARFAHTSWCRAYLQREMRVIGRRSDGRFHPGRVYDYFVQNDGSIDYEIRFPNDERDDINERDLEVRCLRPRSDPAEVLALFGPETQYLNDRRVPVIETLLSLEAAAQGLAGLVSASVEFVPHQVAAVRRVLQDPLPRYLLADEVGLGKTIEAGAILRQWKLDDPDLNVIILAPGPLTPQWKRELKRRFGLDEEENGVRVRTHEEATAVEFRPDVVVIDEAHRVTGRSNDPASQAAVRLAEAANRLLLVSAIPALADEAAFLGLLKLIDPNVYASESTVSFRARIEQRQDYGRLLLGLRSGASGFILKQRASGAREAFPNDPLVQEHAGRLLETDDEGERSRACVALRDHIADTYRIHHRIVRNRRSDCPEWVFQPRGPMAQEGELQNTAHVRIDPDEDERSADLSLALEDWRLTACAWLCEGPAEGEEERLARRFRGLLEALGMGVEEIGAVASGLEPIFDGEEGLLRDIRDIAARPARERTRFEVAADAAAMTLAGLTRDGVRAPKLVAFTTSREASRKLVKALAARLGESRVLDQGADEEEGRSIAERFEEAGEAQALVLDRNGEEGLNLHFAHAVLHYDMPFSPERLEQRIGRLDRFGRTQGVLKQAIIVPCDEEGSPWTAWLKLLAQGFAIFNRSVSDVQFLLRDLERDIETTLLHGGAAEVLDLIAWTKARIANERQALDEQYVLDQVAFASESGERLADALDDAEADEEAMAAPIDEWLFGVLKFRRFQGRRDDEDVFRIGWAHNTLLPKDPWESLFAGALGNPLTWKRRVVLKHDEASVVRPGAPLIEALTRVLRWDDRGSAFATWRVAPEIGQGEWWLGFRLFFVIEPNFPERDAVLAGPSVDALRRRAVSLLAPWTLTLILDADLQEAVDPQIVHILSAPFRSRSYIDINLGTRLDALTEAIDLVRFQDLCLAARDRGHELARARPEFLERVDGAREAAREALERKKRRLRLRRAVGDLDLGDLDLAFDERVVEAVSNPDLRLDSIGFFVITDHKPKYGTA